MNCGESDVRNNDYYENFTPEKFFQLLIPQKNPLIIDIGAHTGESVEFFSSIYPGADIYSVEPDPDNYKKLLACMPNKKRALNLAVGSKSGVAKFFQYDQSHLNSLYAINKESVDSLGYASSSTGREIEVRCLTLNDLVEELAISNKRISLLKIDAQGAEVDILIGAQSMLKQVDNITLEINFFDFYSKKNNFLEVEKLLPGFELYSINKLSQNPKNFRTDWAEVFYRNAEL
jgi:FkbM family methyltransferase